MKINTLLYQKNSDALGYNTTGYGCQPCIGNSGELVPEVD